MEIEQGLKLSELREGMKLPEIKRIVTQGNINLYAEASRDFNPIHIDEHFARKTPFGGTIAHGMLILAYVSQMMTATFGPRWFSGGKLSIKFKAPARPGDTITVGGRILNIKKSEGQALIRCDVLLANQHGEPVIIGTTSTISAVADHQAG